jgi:hypothetical protein
MEIVILRHGKVNYPPITMISASEFTDWVASYNTNELDNSSEPTEETKTIAREAKTIVCSELSRSIASARVLGVRKISLVHSLFNEADLPIAPWRYPKLSVRIWVIFFRLSWFFGYSNGSETLKEAKGRAQRAAGKLVELAKEHQSVLFIGHGIINRFIASELKRNGWQGPKTPSNKYWGYGVYTNKT